MQYRNGFNFSILKYSFSKKYRKIIRHRKLNFDLKLMNKNLNLFKWINILSKEMEVKIEVKLTLNLTFSPCVDCIILCLTKP